MEIDQDCREVIAARMREGYLHQAEIWKDVSEFQASPDTLAQGCGGGFPCQAAVICFIHELNAWQNRPLANLTCAWQGISCGGKQRGLRDPRSSLLRHVFRVFDTIPSKQRPKTLTKCSFISCSMETLFFRPSRRFLYLENVKSILTKQKDMQKVMHYLVQAQRQTAID